MKTNERKVIAGTTTHYVVRALTDRGTSYYDFGNYRSLSAAKTERGRRRKWHGGGLAYIPAKSIRIFKATTTFKEVRS